MQAFCQRNWNLTKFYGTLRDDKSFILQLINRQLYIHIVSFVFYEIA